MASKMLHEHVRSTQASDAPIPGGSVAERRLECLEVWGGSSRLDDQVAVTGLDVWTFSRPADDVAGGDLYLVSMCACAEVSRFLLADVAGHDAETAEVAKRLRKIMRKHINKPDQTQLACALNRDFDGMRRHGKFATAVLMTFFPPSSHLIFCNAGHPRPLLYRAVERRWYSLDPDDPDAPRDAGNLPFGVLGDAPYRQVAVKMQPDDLVLLYTDGVSEMFDSEGKMVGETGILNCLNHIGSGEPGQLLPALRTALQIREDGRDRNDDMTLMLLRANGEQPPHQSLSEKLKVIARMMGILPS